MRELRLDEIVAGYRAAVEEQSALINRLQEQRQTLRLEWAKVQAYMAECTALAASPEMKRKLAAMMSELEEIEKKLSYHQHLVAVLGRKAAGMEDQWVKPVSVSERLAARRVV